MSNVLGDHKQQQVLALGRLGWSLRRIETETGVRRETASAYLKAAGIPVRPSGSWGRRPAKPANEVSPDLGGLPRLQNRTSVEVAGDESAKPANEVSPDLALGSMSPSPVASACEPYREFIEHGLELGRNAKAIWQDLVEEHHFTAQYASVKRFVHKLTKDRGPEAHPIIVTPPGEEGQVDYGSGPMVGDGAGRYRRTRLFVLTLGFSRKSIRLLSFRSSTRIWAELHEQAFRRLGGVPRIVVLDNLREGVIEPDVFDPSINKLYLDVLRHYGATALPCRPRHANRKGKVESGVGHAKQILKGLRFDTIEEAQAYLDRWEERWADTRIHGTTKRQVAAMFEEERPHLLPLPLEPFRYWQRGTRPVDFYGCVEVASAFYSAPPGWLGRTVNVEWDEHRVRILDPKNGQLLREHDRKERGGRSIKEPDRSKRTRPSTQAVLERAQHAGRNIGEVAAQIHTNDGDAGAQRVRGLLALAKKHGPSVVDDACALAIKTGVPTYRFVRRYLDHRPALPLTLRQVDPLIRELTHYRDLIDRLTQEEPT